MGLTVSDRASSTIQPTMIIVAHSLLPASLPLAHSFHSLPHRLYVVLLAVAFICCFLL